DRGGFQSLASGSANTLWGLGINVAGVVAGFTSSDAMPSDRTNGFTAAIGGTPVLVTALGGSACGINDLGQVAATEPGPTGGSRAFRVAAGASGGGVQYVGQPTGARF